MSDECPVCGMRSGLQGCGPGHVYGGRECRDYIKAERERLELALAAAQAACAAYRIAIEAIGEWTFDDMSGLCDGETRASVIAEAISLLAAPNPGQPLLDRLAKMERAIAPLACGDLLVAMRGDKWVWTTPEEIEASDTPLSTWRGPFDAPAAALLAGLAELEKEQGNG
jgi:hypothetical protein